MESQNPSIIVNGGTVNITISNDKESAKLLMQKQDAETSMRTEVNEIVKQTIIAFTDISKKFVDMKAKEAESKSTPKTKKSK